MSERNTVKKTTITLRIIWALLGLFFVITVVSQFYIYFYSPLRTETAMIYNTSETVTFKGVHVRNEKLVRYSGTDVISYIHADGAKIGRNSVVALRYKSVNDILLGRRIDELTQRVFLLEEAQELSTADTSRLESYISQISNQHTSFLAQVNAGDYSNVSSHKNNYISLNCKKLILRGDEINYIAQISRLEAEISALRTQMNTDVRELVIDEAGYFVSVVDGYEGQLKIDSATLLGKTDIEDIIKEPRLEIGDGIVGKMIDGYKWRFVGILDDSRADSLYENLTIDFRTGGNSQTFPATIIRRTKLDDGTSIFVFECDILTPEFASRRVSQFSIVLDSFRGIRIPTSAVHINDKDEQGVYVQNGAELTFKRIRVIITESDYFLVEDTTNVVGYISLYDNVVVRGRDLYDGKIVQ
ncbi:MAG: hypothetical protein FWG70_01680 [Oscillospiraceae bacterium]|nr:hypothetical protein [Oscillospiraceae bacterium]